MEKEGDKGGDAGMMIMLRIPQVLPKVLPSIVTVGDKRLTEQEAEDLELEDAATIIRAVFTLIDRPALEKIKKPSEVFMAIDVDPISV